MRRIYKVIGHVILAIIFAILGVLFSLYSWHGVSIGLESKNWKSATTTITYTYGIRAWGYKQSGLEYVLYPHYSFVAADGKTYEGNQYSISSTEKTDRKNATDAEIRAHLVVVDRIYYDPNDPRRSTVEKPYFDIVFIVFFLFPIMIFFVTYMIFDEAIKIYRKRD